MMSKLDRIKWILAIVGGVIIAALVAVAVLAGNGAIIVVAPRDAAVTVAADGAVLGTVEPGKHARFNVEQGKHTITLSTPARAVTHAIDVGSGAYDQVLPVGEQCFAHLDVTQAWHEPGRPKDRVLVEATYAGGAPFDTPTGVVFATGDLPAEAEEGKHAEVLLEVPCGGIGGETGAVIEAALGG
ncbi:MAG: hypothetical protein JNK45_11230 [Myxococcales bacterium]|nr:hypothetical protein [Myxococcales bacterium]